MLAEDQVELKLRVVVTCDGPIMARDLETDRCASLPRSQIERTPTDDPHIEKVRMPRWLSLRERLIP